METIRKPAVAGMFYPADPDELARTVDRYLDEAPAPAEHSRLVMSPHAGYVYSGATAGYAHRNLDSDAKRVIVLGPTHRVGIEGMALSGADWQETPLGPIRTDAEISAILEEEFSQVVTAPVVHAAEHSIEVQLPFLQRHLAGDFTVVPLAVGICPAPVVAAVFDRFWDWPQVAFVVSSDLSHYLPYEQARVRDAATLAQILAGSPPLTGEQACGAYPVSGLMHFANSRGLSGNVLQACNSGDTAGDKERVVGYAAVAWLPARGLPLLAYNTIAENLEVSTLPIPPEDDLPFAEPGATFVTITIDGKLRGCMGTIQTDQPLRENLAKNALAAAFGDPRFPPLTAPELAHAQIEVSELTTPERMSTGLSEAEVCSRLRPLVDGVILTYGQSRATFLPHVWGQLPDPCAFLAQLKRKAGLDARFWDENIVVETYQAKVTSLKKQGEEPWGT